jgi:hypothetical protein
MRNAANLSANVVHGLSPRSETAERHVTEHEHLRDERE